ncbi:hypothetical protein [Vibrio parahaemolyticus]
MLNAGDTVAYNGHTFRVEKAEKRRILRVRMEKSLPIAESQAAIAQ